MRYGFNSTRTRRNRPVAAPSITTHVTYYLTREACEAAYEELKSLGVHGQITSHEVLGIGRVKERRWYLTPHRY